MEIDITQLNARLGNIEESVCRIELALTGDLKGTPGLFARLTAIERKADDLHRDIRHLTEPDGVISDLQRRVRDLEKYQWKTLGACSILSLIIVLVGRLVLK